jgi:hypothetical protein
MPYQDTEKQRLYYKNYNEMRSKRRKLDSAYKQSQNSLARERISKRRAEDPVGLAKELREQKRRKSHNLKVRVLTHYGLHGKLKCCWDCCNVTDVDMLSLDHIKDDGAKHRKTVKASGSTTYEWIRKYKFPKGFQTLCMNHQFKKRMLKAQRERESQ